MTPLAKAAADYLALRRTLGFKLRHYTWWLPDFVNFVESTGSSTITTALALRWAQQPPDASAGWWARRLTAIRQFARHHYASDPHTEVPPADLLPLKPRRRVRPYLYTDHEIAALLHQARCLPDPLKSYATILGLLAVTGMRVGEALALDREDVDWNRSLLRIRNSKFGKSRELPIHPSTIAALKSYARARGRLGPSPRAASFFTSGAGTRVLHQNFHRVFLRLIRLAGIGKRHVRRPRLHDLRHTFAVKIVRDWHRAGVDVERRMPWLSTYLGHVSPSSTYWYLTATPELLAPAADRLERAWGEQP
jgi:integrase/recombinase XerD